MEGTVTVNRGRFGLGAYGGKDQASGWFVGSRATWSF